MNSESRSLRSRLKALYLRPVDIGLDDEFYLLEEYESGGIADETLVELLEDRVEEAELAYRDVGFAEPEGIPEGQPGSLSLFTAAGGKKISFSLSGGDNLVGHCLIAGPTGFGKTVLLGEFAAQAADQDCDVFLLTANASVLKNQSLEGFMAANAASIRLNPWECPENVDATLWDQQVNQVLGKALDLQYGSLELAEVCAEIRNEGSVPTLPSVIKRLKQKQTKAYSRRNQYRDSAILNLQYLLDGAGNVFSGRGTAPEDLFSRRLVFIAPFAPRIAGLLQHLLLVWAWLLRTNTKPGRRLLFCVDEAQAISDKRALPELILQLRHAAIHWVGCYQNFSAVPREVIGNVDLITCFRTIEEADAKTATSSMALTRRAGEELYRLMPRDVVVYMPRSKWPHAIRATVNKARIKTLSDYELEKRNEQASNSLNPAEPERQEKQKVRVNEKETMAVTPQGILTGRARRLLMAIALCPFMTTTESYKASGLSIAAGDRGRKELSDRSLMSEISVRTGKPGRPPNALLCTENGFAELGLESTQPQGNGSDLHKYWQYKIASNARALGYKAAIDRGLGATRKRVDVTLWKNGKCIAIEVELSKANIERNLQANLEAGADYIIIATNSKLVAKNATECANKLAIEDAVRVRTQDLAGFYDTESMNQLISPRILDRVL